MERDSDRGRKRERRSRRAGPFVEGGSSNSPEERERRKKYGRCVRVMWKEKLRLLKGTAPALVLEKKIVEADVCEELAMLFLCKRGEDEIDEDGEGKRLKELLNFMTDDEKKSAEKGGAPLLLLDRKGDEYPGTRIFRLEGTRGYAIAGQWLDFVDQNQLRAGDMIDVYCFRVPSQGEWRLGLAVCSRVPADEMVRRVFYMSDSSADESRC